MRNLYQLKDTGYCINEGFSKATLNIKAGLWDEVKRLKRKCYYAVLRYDRIVTNKWDEVVQEQVCLINTKGYQIFLI